MLLLLLVCAVSLSAKGKQEEEIREPQNTEFTLCITAFDVSALPPSQQVLGTILQRELAQDLGRIHHRVRNDEELTRYQDLAWIVAQQEAAAKLAEKRAERDALLFQGAPDWKYRKELNRIGLELEELEEAYKKAVEEKPLIAEKSLFTISAANTGKEGTFPPPPARGGEESFLKNQNADALLEGKFRLLYGRIYAEFRLFTRGASFVYEDSTIFSPEDLNAASDELKSRFLEALYNSEPVRLTLHSDPDHAWLEVNGRQVSSGETLKLPPGPVTVRASADDHQSEVRELELEGGDTEEIAFVLKPFTMEALGLTLPGPGSSIYMGALYLGGNAPSKTETEETETAEIEAEETETTEAEAGEIEAEKEVEKIATTEAEKVETAETTAEVVETAGDEGAEVVEAEGADETETAAAEEQAGFFSIYVPAGQYRYIRVETEDGLTGEAIVKGSEGSRGSPEEETRTITLEPRKLPGKDEKPVEDKRQKFYGAYGRFWIAMPLAFVISGFNQLYNNTYTLAFAATGSQAMYDTASMMTYVSIGAWVAAGAFLVESLIRMGIYIHTATKESIPLYE
jgi:hypothetical protein